MAISEGSNANFQTLLRAVDNNSLALMECTDKATGKPVNVICTVSKEGGEYVFTPFAKMFEGNPYDEVDPPV